MKPFNITTNGITKLLKNLNPYKAQGPDNLSPRILKELVDEISPLLQLIYTKSLDTGEVPRGGFRGGVRGVRPPPPPP